MRTREDNLLKIADEYEGALLDGGFDECYDDIELAATFKEVITDYKKIISVCEKEGVDTGDDDIEEFEKDFDTGTADDKEETINKIKERVMSLIDICDNVPKHLDKKYIKDLVDMINNCND